MIEVGEARPDHLHWIEEKTGCILTRNARAICAWKDKLIVGMVAYDNWTPNSCQAHMAVEYPQVWLRMIRPAFDYPFNFAKKKLILAVIPSDNVRSWNVAQKMGFELKHIVQDGWAADVNLRLYEMRKEHCRWLKERV